MSVDLTLCPASSATSLGGWFLSYQRIRVEQDYVVLGQVGDIARGHEGRRVVSSWPLPPNTKFDWYEDEGIKRYVDDPYGDTLTYTTALELAKVSVEDSTPWNKALWQMIRALPPETAFVLWWS